MVTWCRQLGSPQPPFAGRPAAQNRSPEEAASSFAHPPFFFLRVFFFPPQAHPLQRAGRSRARQGFCGTRPAASSPLPRQRDTSAKRTTTNEAAAPDKTKARGSGPRLTVLHAGPAHRRGPRWAGSGRAGPGLAGPRRLGRGPAQVGGVEAPPTGRRRQRPCRARAGVCVAAAAGGGGVDV